MGSCGHRRFARRFEIRQRVNRGRGGGGGGDVPDDELAQAIDKGPRLYHVAFVLFGFQFDHPRQQTVLRVQRFQTGQGGSVAAHRDITHVSQRRQDEKRIIARREQIGERVEPDGEPAFWRCPVEIEIFQRQSQRFEFDRGGVGLGLVFRKPFQFCQQRGFQHAVGVGTAPRICDKIRQMIGGAKEQRHRCRQSLDPATAQFIHRRFKPMGKADQCFEPEGSGTPLDRMNGAKHRIDGFAVAGLIAQLRQSILQRLLQLFTFGKEGCPNLCQWIRHHQLTPSPCARL